MFILRRITEDSVEINTWMGSDYVLIFKETNHEEFKKVIIEWPESDLVDLFGVITFDYGESIMPLYRGSLYYVMTVDGKTFSKITYKP